MTALFVKIGLAVRSHILQAEALKLQVSCHKAIPMTTLDASRLPRAAAAPAACLVGMNEQGSNSDRLYVYQELTTSFSLLNQAYTTLFWDRLSL
jgi:hypothetical protein